MDNQINNDSFRIFRIRSWEDAKEISKYFHNWAFRGQAEDIWDLTTTIERNAKRFQVSSNFLKNIENRILSEFQRRAHQYINNPPEKEDFLDWLALVQHFGGPTRLLDFTHSFYIATLFAVESTDKDGAIWGINLSNLELSLWENATDKEQEMFGDLTNLDLVKISNLSISDKYKELKIIYVEPERLHERISIQKGLFLFPCNIKESFQVNLISTFNMEPNIFKEAKEENLPNEDLSDLSMKLEMVKIIFPRELHIKIIEDLEKMNITYATLFPGLDGFARSLSYQLRKFETASRILDKVKKR